MGCSDTEGSDTTGTTFPTGVTGTDTSPTTGGTDGATTSGGGGGGTDGTTATAGGGSGGTTPGTSGGATTSGGSSGGSFVENPDGGGGAVECDIWAQDCPAGEKCMPWANDGGSSWNATKCSPVDPNPNQVGDPCTVEGSGVSGIDSCDEAMMCWDVDSDTGMGVCVAFCTGSEAAPQCADAGSSCNIRNDGVLILCLPGCDPLLQDCPSTQECLPNSDGQGFHCVPDGSGDAGVAGDPCEYGNSCDPGLYCESADLVSGCTGASGCCAPFCDLTDSNACAGVAGGVSCVPWYKQGTAPPGQENIGSCVLPP